MSPRGPGAHVNIGRPAIQSRVVGHGTTNPGGRAVFVGCGHDEQVAVERQVKRIAKLVFKIPVRRQQSRLLCPGRAAAREDIHSPDAVGHITVRFDVGIRVAGTHRNGVTADGHGIPEVVADERTRRFQVGLLDPDAA